MTREQYPPARAAGRFVVAAALATFVGLLAGRSPRRAGAFGVAVGGVVAAGDYALWRFVDELEVLDAEFGESVEEIEVQIEEPAGEE